MYFVDVILPIPVEKTFTYQVNEAEYAFIKPGMRLAVPFGKSKIYTALSVGVHTVKPTVYEAKEIEYILDESPVVHLGQLNFWKWIATYYMCTLGEVMRAALPNAFLLESETIIKHKKGSDLDGVSVDDDDMQLLIDALQDNSSLKIQEVMNILGKKKVLPVIQKLIDNGMVEIEEEIYEVYRPKLIDYIKLSKAQEGEAQIQDLLSHLENAPKQRELLLSFFSLKAKSKKPVKRLDLQKAADASSAQINALVKKDIFEIYTIKKDRIDYDNSPAEAVKTLNQAQTEALQKIKVSFTSNDVCLLHGVTSSGKTEIYASLIQEMLDQGNQVLYLLPEIALTTQLVTRLQFYFGDSLSVYHSRYTVHERVEVWNNVLQNKKKAQLILGARSSVLLPFDNLGLVVIDEEHEPSYKQFDPAPRYQARDAAVVLAHQQGAKVLMGSATPALETYYNAKHGKYSLVDLARRFGNVLMPENIIVDIKEKKLKKRMTGHFSDDLLGAVNDALSAGEQIIFFQNRRGYSPILECNTCGHSPQCPNCDVSLTYHKHRSQLRCHYCGYHIAMLQKCMACGSEDLSTKGFGTEQIEAELRPLFPEAIIARMDSDTTRGKYGFEKIITAFEQGDTDILVGTQMLTRRTRF